MTISHARNWIVGIFSLCVIYVSALLFLPHLLKRVPPTKPGEVVHQIDGPTLTLEIGEGQKIDMTRIVAGDFQMGSPQSEVGHDLSEEPVHTVHITHDFYIGIYDITQAQWTAVMKKNQSAFPESGDLPAEQVSWDDCQKFCQIISRINGRTVRLPTEAEWEYACRAGSQSPFTYGDSLSSNQANFNGEAPYGDAAVGPKRDKTTPVGTFPANAWGLYDVHGDVWQWCQDVFHPSYDGAPTDGSAWEKGEDAEVHVYRGGSYMNNGDVCRAATRWAARHDTRASTIGFRVVADLMPAK